MQIVTKIVFVIVAKLGVIVAILPLAAWFWPASQCSHLILWQGSQGKDEVCFFLAVAVSLLLGLPKGVYDVTWDNSGRYQSLHQTM